MASPSKHYDKFTYAVKRRSEKETASPNHPRPCSASGNGRDGPLAPLTLNRDGFAVAEDGSLQSRVVSPPRFLHIDVAQGVAVPSATIVSSPVRGTIASASFNAGQPGSPMRVLSTLSAASVGSPQGSFYKPGGGNAHAAASAASAAPPAYHSPSQSFKSPSVSSLQPNAYGSYSSVSAIADPWAVLVSRVAGELTEEELALLHWDTVHGLLMHYKISNPVDVAKAQLTWKTKQLQLVGETRMGADPETTDQGTAGDEHVVIRTAPLTTSPIQVIAYGRPESPREGGRFVPAHKKPLKWSGIARVDSGLPKRGGSASK